MVVIKKNCSAPSAFRHIQSTLCKFTNVISRYNTRCGYMKKLNNTRSTPTNIQRQPLSVHSAIYSSDGGRKEQQERFSSFCRGSINSTRGRHSWDEGSSSSYYFLLHSYFTLTFDAVIENHISGKKLSSLDEVRDFNCRRYSRFKHPMLA